MDWIDKAATACCKLLEALVVALLAAMVAMVFGAVTELQCELAKARK